ncbi:hypothetical protein [Jeotgalibacillus salarius]|uniref:Uncharacterized protein n=1 Tax=Jeotgalibacillus salarius TaxID=546023 RepID=A0A4Y8LIQ8_9BACL|nr:hypothetical protein [Jeotgalibacillus salarius]TFE02271.1 hypothetical protein E2626_06745 [Jeotgalibacillus salarius]
MKRTPGILVAGFIVLCFFIFPQGSNATSWAYMFVVWDGYVYVVSEEIAEEVGNEIGEVTAFSDMEQLSGNFSNAYREGTKYYSIEGTDTSEAIAVEVGNRYIKAYREQQYQTSDTAPGSEPDYVAGGLIFAGFTAVGGLGVYLFRRRVSAKAG